MSYWRKIRTAGMGRRRWETRFEAKEASKRKRRREDKIEATSQPEAYSCPNCGSAKQPVEVERPVTTYWRCRDCDFSTWDRSEFLVPEWKPATDEEIERSFDAYR